MIFLKHESFPDAYANIVRHYEYQAWGESFIRFPPEEYGPDVRPEEWLACVAKQAKQHRPTILMLDDGVKANSIRLAAMRELGCCFTVFARAWADEPFHPFSWKLLRWWPDVVGYAVAAEKAGLLCRMEVSINGKVRVTNL